MYPHHPGHPGPEGQPPVPPTAPVAPPPRTEREIFEYEYPAGTRRYADPLAVRRRMIQETAGELNHVLQQASAGPIGKAPASPSSPEAEEYHGRLVERERFAQKRYEVICAAFGLPPFDEATGAGLTERRAVAIFNAFLGWLAKNGMTPGS